jgi:hypothetical protein
MKRFFALLVVSLALFNVVSIQNAIAAETLCCVCQLSNDASKGNTCVNVEPAEGGTNCEKIPQTHSNLQGYTCTAPPTGVLCSNKSTSASGICNQGPINVNAYSLKADAAIEKPSVVAPTLGVPIPGIVFSQNIIQNSRSVSIPFLAQYIAGVYRYLIGISAVAAAVMIVWGGFLYIWGSTSGNIQKGKDIITDATIGLFLVLGAYIILSSLNSNLVQLKPLELHVIKTEIQPISDTTYQSMQQQANTSGYTPDPEIVKALKISTGGDQPATRMFPNNPFDPRKTIPPSELDLVIEAVAKSTNTDGCILKAIINTESGRRQNAVGHDEDAEMTDLFIQSRLDFLRSGKKKGGAAVTSSLPGVCNKENKATCQQALKDSVGVKNDDDLNSQPPEFGLDWRFSHGLGVGQVTVFPKNVNGFCTGADGAYGRTIGGKCFTVPILLTWEGQLEAMALLMKGTAGKNACAIFCAYGGACGVDPNCTSKALQAKMNAYNACKGTK